MCTITTTIFVAWVILGLVPICCAGSGRHRPPSIGGIENLRKDRKMKATQEEVAELLAQVEKDLEPWKISGIRLEMVEKAYCTTLLNEDVYFASFRLQV